MPDIPPMPLIPFMPDIPPMPLIPSMPDIPPIPDIPLIPAIAADEAITAVNAMAVAILVNLRISYPPTGCDITKKVGFSQTHLNSTNREQTGVNELI
jgi:hypothetical protein